jgi:hypothetical protein
LRTAPPTGEAAKLTDDVTYITSYSRAWKKYTYNLEMFCDPFILPLA